MAQACDLLAVSYLYFAFSFLNQESTIYYEIKQLYAYHKALSSKIKFPLPKSKAAWGTKRLYFHVCNTCSSDTSQACCVFIETVQTEWELPQ